MDSAHPDGQRHVPLGQPTLLRGQSLGHPGDVAVGGRRDDHDLVMADHGQRLDGAAGDTRERPSGAAERVDIRSRERPAQPR